MVFTIIDQAFSLANDPFARVAPISEIAPSIRCTESSPMVLTAGTVALFSVFESCDSAWH